MSARKRGNDGRSPVPHGLDDGVHGVDGHQGPGRVMDEDDGDVVRQGVEAELHGLLSRGPAGHDDVVGALGQRVPVDEVLDLGRTVRGRDQDHEGDGP